MRESIHTTRSKCLILPTSISHLCCYAVGNNGRDGGDYSRSAAASLPGTPTYSSSSAVLPRSGTRGSAKAGNLLQQLPSAPVYKFSIVRTVPLLCWVLHMSHHICVCSLEILLSLTQMPASEGTAGHNIDCYACICLPSRQCRAMRRWLNPAAGP